MDHTFLLLTSLLIFLIEIYRHFKSHNATIQTPCLGQVGSEWSHYVLSVVTSADVCLLTFLNSFCKGHISSSQLVLKSLFDQFNHLMIKQRCP